MLYWEGLVGCGRYLVLAAEGRVMSTKAMRWGGQLCIGYASSPTLTQTYPNLTYVKLLSMLHAPHPELLNVHSNTNVGNSSRCRSNPLP